MLISFLRAVILYIVLMISVRFTGKRQLGDVEPAELIVTILITELASAPLQDAGTPLITSIVTIGALVCFEIIFSVIAVKNPVFARIFQGSSTVLIKDGKTDQKALIKADITVDELDEALRRNGALSPSDVRYCVLEASGKMSVLLKKDIPPGELPRSVIVNGKEIPEVMKACGISKDELSAFLDSSGVKKQDVFRLTCAGGRLTLTKKEEDTKDI